MPASDLHDPSRPPDRRGFLRAGAALATGALAAGALAGVAPAAADAQETGTQEATPAWLRPAAPGEEPYWERVRGLFALAPGAAILSHGAGGAVPAYVAAQVAAYARLAATGVWDVAPFAAMKESGSSRALRERMAAAFGCAPEEVALMRNTMEGIATCLRGIDLRPGDEVLSTTADYDSCLAILKQRERRDGVRLRLVDPRVPVDPADVLARVEAAITPRTRLLLVSHVAYGLGAVLPVRELCALARRHNVLSVVDGAHAPGHLAFRLGDLGCDCYAAGLHKWFLGPRGTGMLYVRRERIRDVWPLFAPYTAKADDDVEKFEEVGSVQRAAPAALPLAFDFHARVGAAAVQARLVYLRDRWARPLARMDRVRFLTDLTPGRSGALAAFAVDGADTDALQRTLRERFGLQVRTLGNPYAPQLRGLQLGLGLANGEADADRLVDAVATLLHKG